VQGLHYDYEVEAIVAAGYGQKDFKLSPRTILDVGVRAEYTHYSYDNQADVGRSGRFMRHAARAPRKLRIYIRFSSIKSQVKLILKPWIIWKLD